jgi:2-methylcitrate dehydratase PrpD
VACAAAAAHLLHLTPEQAGHALGIAEYHAPNLPMMRDIAHPTMVKHGIGWAAMTGVVSATLAANGYTGIPSILSFPEYQGWMLPGGARSWHDEDFYLMVDGVAWKAERYACCGWAHAGVEGARRLVRENGLPLEHIEKIVVAGSRNTVSLGASLPATTEEAQFNQAWPLAAMLVDDEIGPIQMLEDRLGDPQIRSLARKVELVEDPELEALCVLFEKGDTAGRFASRVTITLDDGREFQSGLVDGGLRFPQPGWDEERVADKFRWTAGFVAQPPKCEALIDLAWQFETLPSVRSLIDTLVN